MAWLAALARVAPAAARGSAAIGAAEGGAAAATTGEAAASTGRLSSIRSKLGQVREINSNLGMQFRPDSRERNLYSMPSESAGQSRAISSRLGP